MKAQLRAKLDELEQDEAKRNLVKAIRNLTNLAHDLRGKIEDDDVIDAESIDDETLEALES